MRFTSPQFLLSNFNFQAVNGYLYLKNILLKCSYFSTISKDLSIRERSSLIEYRGMSEANELWA